MALLLPKSKEEFSKTDYWDTFFKSRGSKAFEWYGEYNELSGYLHKYIKEKDKILITGCGNSSIGHNLYDMGCRDITNIDVSKTVIRQMNQKVNNRDGLKFIEMDALHTTFQDGSFNVVLDKGTLDALMPDNEEASVQRINTYFSEIQRISTFGGRYLCITLLQEHILKIILNYFPKNNWMLRIIRCFEPEQAAVENGEKLIPVFMVICTKFTKLPKYILEINLSSTEKMQRLEDVDQVESAISSCQKAVFICSNLQQNSISSENEISLDLYETDDPNPKYTVFVVDIPPEKKNSPYAMFIVPQGRESEWLFSTREGRKKLASISNHNRLLITTMHRNKKYGNLEDIQNELIDIIRDLTPSNMKHHKIPYLSLGTEGVGERKIFYEGISEMSGSYIVEDVKLEDNKFRRLYFLSNQFVIQSEAKLKMYKNRKGAQKEVIDLTYLTCKHHMHMTLASHVACGTKPNSSLAVIGVGGGGLCSFLNKFLPRTMVTGVEIDSEMIRIATEYFGLKENNTLLIEVNDGIKFLQKYAHEGKNLDAILFDVDSKDSSIGMSCPPKQFLEKSVLENVKNIIGNEGTFILNVVLRDENLRSSIMDRLGEKFEGVTPFKIPEELNEIFICTSKNDDNLRENMIQALEELKKFLQKHNNLNCLESLDFPNCLSDIET